jgi:hypothetical protein
MPQRKLTQVTLELTDEVQKEKGGAHPAAWILDEGWTYAFSLRLSNTGDTTIRRAKLKFIVERPAEWKVGWNKAWIPADIENQVQFELPPKTQIYPGEAIYAPDRSLVVQSNSYDVVSFQPFRIVWKVFLDNAQPCKGAIDIAAAVKEFVDRQRAELDAEYEDDELEESS